MSARAVGLVLWGAAAFGAPLFIALGIHAPRGHYGAALATFACAAPVWGLWMVAVADRLRTR